jgi:hypothetical protein
MPEFTISDSGIDIGLFRNESTKCNKWPWQSVIKKYSSTFEKVQEKWRIRGMKTSLMVTDDAGLPKESNDIK